MISNIKKRIEKNKNLEDSHIICKFPKNMLLEPTNACNHACLFCANSKSTRGRKYIDRELAFKTLKQAYDLGTREVGFYGTGEPLLNNDLEDYISYAKHLGYKYIYITTNGALLSPERAKTIVEAGIDSIKFSINASNTKEYQLIHGKDEFDKVMCNLINLDKMRKEQGKEFYIYISYVVTRYTALGKDKFKEKYKKYVDDIIFYDCVNISGYMAKEITTCLSINSKVGYHPPNDICPMIFKTLYITSEGYLTMCCADFQNYLVVADLNVENLEKAWNNQYAQNLRQHHLEHKLDGLLCNNCIYNCENEIVPLVERYGIKFDYTNWNNLNLIKKRIEKWKKN